MRLFGEAARSALAQPVSTIVTALIVAGVCAVILSTTGQTVLIERQILAQIDAAGTRSIVISDSAGDAGMTREAVERINRISSVEWAIGLGPAMDITNAGIPGGTSSAIRTIYGGIPPAIEVTGRAPQKGEALVGPEAQRLLGLQAPSGGAHGAVTVAVVGGFQAAEPLAFLNRSLITPPGPDESTVRSIHILVEDSSQVTDTTRAALLLLGADNPISIQVETSQALAQVRAAIAGELGTHSRRLVAIVLASGLILTALSVYGAVNSRRKDFGRRRVLGASRITVVILVALQALLAAVIGASVGTLATAIVLTQASGQPPDPAFSAAVTSLALIVTTVAALPPALVAAYRDPLKVLRVP